MSGNRFWILAGVAAVLLGSGVALRMHTSNQQALPGGSKMFADLSPALGDVSEIRLSKGDGSRTTLRRGADGWTVVERQFPADSGRVRELVLGMVDMKVIEPKTSDP